MPGIPSWKMTFRRGKGMAKKPSRIKMDLGGFVPHELRQNHPKTQLGKDFRDLRWCSLWTLVWCHVGFRMLRHPYLGLSDYPNWTWFWRFDDETMSPGGVMRMFMVHGPFRGRPWLMDQEDRLTSLWPPRGFLAEWAEWLREPPIFSNENLDPQYGKPKGTSPYYFAGHHPQLSYWGCSLDPWDSLHLLSAAPIHWRWSN